METATEDRRERALRAFLAGLQAGMLGAICLLAWLGASALRTGQGFWAAANLMASVLYGAEAIGSGFSGSTLSGVALYLLLYSLLGALFAMAFQSRMSRLRLTLVSILFTIFWYYLSFGVLWKIAAPLLARLHYARATLWGHLIYGAMLSRYPAYLAGPAAEPARAGQAEAPAPQCGPTPPLPR